MGRNLSKGSGILRPKAVRGANSAAILQLLRQYGSMSRADVARQSGLSEGSVSRITSELIRREIVCEDGAENSTGGRPGRRLRLAERHVGLGIEIRRGEVRIASATLSGKILESLTIGAPASPDELLKAAAGAIRSFREKYRKNYIEGLGVSVRGIVNSGTGVVEFGNLPAWVGVPVREHLQASLNMPVLVDNNVRLAAIAEYNYGNLLEVRDSRCLLFAMVDDGIGIGIVLDGKLYYGPRDAAGEFGQMVIADSDDAEQLDRAGCLEKLASSTALCEHYAALTGTRALPGASDSRARVRRICQLALGGDEAALGALVKTCRYLGIGLANVIWGLNADAVVLDAPINEAWPVVGPLIRNQFPKGEDIVTFRNLVLRPSSLGGEATIIGAATLPFRRLFTSGEGRRSSESELRGQIA
jgi:Transcriptional regulator/sugar kinase